MYIAIDIGATKTRVSTFEGLESEEDSFEIFESKHTTNEEVEGIKKSIDKIAERNEIEGIAVAIGMPLGEDGEALNTVNFGENVSTKGMINRLQEEFSIPVKIINDATAGALIETTMQKDGKFLFLTWGTGLGGLIVKRYGGEIELTECEAGHTLIIENGKQCGCGKYGCVEAYVGGKCIEKYYHKEAAKLTKEEWDEVLDYMVMGILKLMDEYDGVEKVIFHGGVALKNPEFLDIIRKRLEKKGKRVPVEQVKAGEGSPVYGALKLFDKNLRVKIIKDFARTVLRHN